ncbi:hypothetical protein BDN70DRAFT_127836 [Pholiota conissans]|uniref:Uncharacterized protein n=1 Tax=Pholiota conissans TaxID=109636 RepID=A0A9P6CXV8_9AGAR|nr:hypothetical protein BDN70DRAFT_127836 [Pholiota conissans]
MERRLWPAIKRQATLFTRPTILSSSLRRHRQVCPQPSHALGSNPGSPLYSSAQFPPTPLDKMVLPHHTPYVTPHILHKNYAQAHDTEQFSNRMSTFRVQPNYPHPIPQSSARISSTSRRLASIWIVSRSSVTPLSLFSTRMPSATRVPLSPLLVL